MSYQKILFTALVLGLIFVNACRIEPSSLLGDLTSFDTSIKFTGAGHIELPSVSFGGSGFTMEIDVFSTSSTGCLYSAGEPGSTYVEVRLESGQIVFTKGTETIRTSRLSYPVNKWAQVSVTLDNASGEATAYINGLAHPFTSQFAQKGLTIAPRAGTIGFCPSNGSRFTGNVDNLIVFNTAQTKEEIEWTHRQFIPFVLSDNLVVYYSFNDVAPGGSGLTTGLIGGAAVTNMDASLVGGPISQLKAEIGKAEVIDTFCSHRGITLAGQEGAAAIPPFMGTANGGATQTVACQVDDATTFVVNQYWQAEGGIKQMTVKTSAFHFWRISAPGLTVEHRTWGGWTMIPRSADTIEVDHTTYKFTDDAVLIQSGVFGFVKITENNGLLAYDFGVNTANCALTGTPVRTSWCDHLMIPEFTYDFSTEAVPEMPLGFKSDAPGVSGQDPVLACPPPSTVYRPDLVQPPPPPPPPPAMLPPPPPAEVDVNPCEDYENGTPAQVALYTAFKQACDALFTPGQDTHTKCMTDSCISGSTTIDKPDCLSEKLKAATNEGYVIDPKCDEPACPNECNGNGECVDAVCNCQAGFTGKACDVPAEYPCFQASSPAGMIPVSPTVLITPSGAPRKTSYLSSNLADVMTANAVEDSTLIYLVSTENDNNASLNDYSLIIMNNNGNGAGDASLSVTLAGATGARFTEYKSGPVTYSKTDDVLSFSWSFNGMVGVLVEGLPANFQGVLTINSKNGVEQVLIGTAHGTNKASGLLAVHKYTKNTINISGTACTNECENLDSCDSCSANAKCGWCVEGARCLPGDRSGPHYYGQCKNWRYSFDNTVSRRLTQEYAYPVSPGATTVYLTETNDSEEDLPLEINVAIGAPEKIQWDVVFLAAWSANHKATWTTQLTTFLPTMRAYPNVGVAIASQHSDGHKIVKVLSNPRDYYWFGQHVDNAPVSTTNNALQGIVNLASSDNNAVGWRSGSRKILIITADTAFPTGVSTDSVRNALMSRDIIPVFIVTSSVRAQYQALRDALGFGFVQTLSASSGNFVSATTRAIQLAAGHAATFYNAADVGHLNTDTWNEHIDSFAMFGLKENFLARFPVPVHRMQGQADLSKTTLHMPAFGSAQIENIKSERPVATAFPLHSSGLEGELQIVELKGRSWQNFAQTTGVITVFPERGTLYQITTIEDVDGNSVISRGDVVPASGVITDSLGRVGYLAEESGFGANYAALTFAVTDGCVLSDEIVITFDVINKNEPPMAEMLPPTGLEDVAQVLSLYATDSDNNDYKAIITQGLHELAEDGTPIADASIGTLYQYDAQFVNSRAEAELNGVAITGPADVTDPSHRVIYWPPLHANSHADYGKTPELLVKPCFNYKVQETATDELFESDVARVPIDIRSVNDAPFIYGDADPNYIYEWAAVDPALCFENCQFEEDFGHAYPWDAEFEYIYMGGGDVEKDLLDFVIVELECDENAVLENDIRGTRVVVGTDSAVIQQNQPGSAVPALRFRPGPDANDNNGGFGTHYCKIGYKVRDVHGAMSEKTHTITINVSEVNDPVRLATEDQLVVALEETAKSFVIDAINPEGTAFTTIIKRCKSTTRGVFVACLDAACQQTQTIDCANLPAEGLTLSPKAKRQVPSGFGYTLTFTSGPITSLSEGLGYQYLEVAFADETNVVGDSFLVNINVVSLNEAPLLFVDPEEDLALREPASDALSVSVPSGSAFSPLLVVADEDINQGDLTVTIDFSPRDGSVMVLDDSALSQSKIDRFDLAGSVIFSGKIAEVNKALESFQFQGKETFGEYTLTIDVNDNGYTGQCGSAAEVDANTLQWDGLLCPLSDKTVITVTYSDQSLVNVAVIAGAGVGVLGITAIGAVAAAKFFNKQAASGDYAPWDAFEGDEPSVANPLYEAATVGGTSSIYQDGGANYVEMGSNGGSYL
eukprot:TRINITY_DN525_c0_g1_i1.p1 TRINITY_DN525_c0_g1~~TRINITY_DN525_c0_g1_i1.p1  ORF type:complete len:1939 (-),score=547.19 TRINITY_DN525_c0_g1_i1:164-5935(-)